MNEQHNAGLYTFGEDIFLALFSVIATALTYLMICSFISRAWPAPTTQHGTSSGVGAGHARDKG
jgi:hypothetical protein